jgi:hypothetical protein
MRASKRLDTIVADSHTAPVNIGNRRKAGGGMINADPSTGRADPEDLLPAPQGQPEVIW